MALHFSSSATSYDSHAALQREIAWQLLEWAWPRLELNGNAPGGVLDIGCGTGYLTGFLLERLPGAHCVAVDMAGGMLAMAGEQQFPGTASFVQADGECLPFAPGSFALAASSTAFQWFDNHSESFSSLARLLAPGGRLAFATLGPGTLAELKESYSEAAGRLGITLTGSRYGPELPDRDNLTACLKSAGFERIETEVRLKREFFSGCQELFRSLKARGANNPNFRPMSLGTERALMREVCRAYERRFKMDGRVFASYEVIFGCCRKGTE